MQLIKQNKFIVYDIELMKGLDLFALVDPNPSKGAKLTYMVLYDLGNLIKCIVRWHNTAPKIGRR